MGELYDAANQQAVRADGSGPWQEGSGAGAAPSTEPEQAKPPEKPEAPEKPVSGKRPRGRSED